ncbi:sigma-54 interaction domain-containing protein [Cardinium endosymbiont of Culicoides punctatus]|uniref:sigma-54 interaction domain-containing protein n=1 Tax=Cardinium endosymbiont of Culicoides punctatus TaxID=2304601 RepID=UPI00105857D6|nr:sigma-54 dependent transcriptional regulator [Cardinium endosymbiont of Culicoides punctatus]TDG95516.1 Nitrogen fixation protein VnfA [Cardinium endosymbiont of Culicoides punctatus]
MKERLQYIKQQFNVIGNAPLLNRAIEIAMQVASTDLSVLITGESGTGKESFSKIIHSLSPYRHGNFIAINCGAIPEGTIDSELFGHEKGSFTGAIEARKGYFEETNGGTIFLDEIGEMPLGTQTRLLRVLEYGEYVKVGSSKVEQAKVRIVAATNVNLLHAIKDGKFREDLYYRLNTVPIAIPPLRERGLDIFMLFHKFSSDFATKYRAKPLELNPAAKEMLLQYPFPGNIRQLKNIVEQIALLEGEIIVTPEVLIRYLPREHSQMLPVLYENRLLENSNSLNKDFVYTALLDLKKDVKELRELMFNFVGSGSIKKSIVQEHPRLFGVHNHQEAEHKGRYLLDLEQSFEGNGVHAEPAITYSENLSIEAKEQELIRRSLQKNHGNRKNTANDLGISERTLYRKIKQYDIEEQNFKK